RRRPPSPRAALPRGHSPRDLSCRRSSRPPLSGATPRSYDFLTRIGRAADNPAVSGALAAPCGAGSARGSHFERGAEMRDRPFVSGARRRKRSFVRAAVLLAIALLALVLAVAASSSQRSGADTPKRGGTLRMLGNSDIFNLDTTSAYYTVSNILERSFTRQLLSYPNAPTFAGQIKLAPDIATAVPSRANGGISPDARTYTLHLKKGVKWDTNPPRQVTADDFVREFKLICNPASPTGA